MRIRFLLVDALNLIRRVYAAQPGDDGPDKVKGSQTACSQSLQRALRETRPTHAVCVFEGEGASWRHLQHAGYKAGRSPMPTALKTGLPGFEEAFSHQGICSLKFSSLEADDVIATLAAKVATRQGRVKILSTDKMFLQLLSPRISVRDHFRQLELDATYLHQKFGVKPEQFLDFLSLTGDSANNIQGVPGVGSKTAKVLLDAYGSLEEVLSAAHRIKGKLGKRLKQHADDARFAQTLVRLKVDLQLGVNLQSFRLKMFPS